MGVCCGSVVSDVDACWVTSVFTSWFGWHGGEGGLVAVFVGGVALLVVWTRAGTAGVSKLLVSEDA